MCKLLFERPKISHVTVQHTKKAVCPKRSLHIVAIFYTVIYFTKRENYSLFWNKTRRN